MIGMIYPNLKSKLLGEMFLHQLLKSHLLMLMMMLQISSTNRVPVVSGLQRFLVHH